MPDKVTRIEKVSSKNDITCVEKNAAEEGKMYYLNLKLLIYEQLNLMWINILISAAAIKQEKTELCTSRKIRRIEKETL